MKVAFNARPGPQVHQTHPTTRFTLFEINFEGILQPVSDVHAGRNTGTTTHHVYVLTLPCYASTVTACLDALSYFTYCSLPLHSQLHFVINSMRLYILTAIGLYVCRRSPCGKQLVSRGILVSQAPPDNFQQLPIPNQNLLSHYFMLIFNIYLHVGYSVMVGTIGSGQRDDLWKYFSGNPRQISVHRISQISREQADVLFTLQMSSIYFVMLSSFPANSPHVYMDNNHYVCVMN